jgi:diaminopimelate decarboxylase
MYSIDTIQKLQQIKTPFWLYDISLLEKTLQKVKSLSEKHNISVHYAIKANAEERILRLISSYGLGADCVSGNEVIKSAECGFSPDKIVYAGVGKTDKEIYDSMKLGIFAFNCESIPEIKVINELAGRMGINASILARINPNIDAHTHKYVTTGLHENKFGISEHEFERLIEISKECKNVTINGLHFHIGSQITDVANVFKTECERVNEIVAWFESRGLKVDHIDLGGGLGIDYETPDDNPIADFDTWIQIIADNIVRRPDQKVHIEPGRSIVAQCGSLISRVLFVKSGETKTFLILDAGMNDLIRPALYGAYHHITLMADDAAARPVVKCDVTGSLCENNDKFAIDRELPEMKPGDLVVLHDAGAHGHAMGFQYNGKLRSAELLLKEDGGVKLIRRAETLADYFATLDFPGL